MNVLALVLIIHIHVLSIFDFFLLDVLLELLHSLDSFSLVLLHFIHEWFDIFVPFEVSFHYPFEFLPILYFDVLHVLPEGQLLILFVDINCVIDQLLKLRVHVKSFILFCFVIVVYFFHLVVMLFIVRSFLGLLVEELTCPLCSYFNSLLLLEDSGQLS